MSSQESRTGSEEEPVRITDKRKIDKDLADGGFDTGVGDAGQPPDLDASLDGPAQPAAVDLLEERTADLQRLQAEYANYRKRAERDRLAAGDLAISRVLTDLLPVLDSLERAKAHDDLTGGLKAVADQLDDIFSRLGLASFGEVGNEFDPSIHEAVQHEVSDDVTAATCTTIMRPGYRHGDRLLRAAMVGVSEPPAGASADQQAD